MHSGLASKDEPSADRLARAPDSAQAASRAWPRPAVVQRASVPSSQLPVPVRASLARQAFPAQEQSPARQYRLALRYAAQVLSLERLGLLLAAQQPAQGQ